MTALALEPVIYMLMGRQLLHGERGQEVDPINPFACLCGYPDYLQCPHADEGISSWIISPAENT